MTRRKPLRINRHIVLNHQIGYGRATIEGTGTSALVLGDMVRAEMQAKGEAEAVGLVADLYERQAQEVFAAVEFHEILTSEWGVEIRRRARLALKYRDEAKAHREVCSDCKTCGHLCADAEIIAALFTRHAVALAELVDTL